MEMIKLYVYHLLWVRLLQSEIFMGIIAIFRPNFLLFAIQQYCTFTNTVSYYGRKIILSPFKRTINNLNCQICDLCFIFGDGRGVTFIHLSYIVTYYYETHSGQ